MASKKLIIYNEILPYHNLFTLNKIWWNLKQDKAKIMEEVHKLRARMWDTSHKLTEIEEKLSEAIVKLDKNNV